MHTIKGTNVNEVYVRGIQMLAKHGVRQASQHGSTLEMDEPVSVMYLNPRERILFDAKRDSNPFLNLFEALWIIAGRNDVKFLQELVGRMATFSDNGTTYYGAYGHRMRYVGHGNVGDQIQTAIDRLKKNPDDRQVVLTIRTQADMVYTGKDQPCNLLVSCKIRQGKLNIHVFNRSNDFIWGLTGTNVVQFSMLQEYMAGMIGVPVGFYHQTTDSMHVYENEQWDKLKNVEHSNDPYTFGDTKPFDMMLEPQAWDQDLSNFFASFDHNNGDLKMTDLFTPFFREVVFPAWYSFQAYKEHRDNKDASGLFDALRIAQDIPADWGTAIRAWLLRRGQK